MKHTGINNYYVTKDGMVLNANRNMRLVKGYSGKHGHIRVELYDDKFEPRNDGRRSKRFFVHRLVATAFIGEIPDGYVVEHLDGDPSNNHVENLKISTQSENIQTAVKHGTFGKMRNSYEFTNLVNGEVLTFKNRDEVFDYFKIYPRNKSVTYLFRFKSVYEEWCITKGVTCKSHISDILVIKDNESMLFETPSDFWFYVWGDYRTGSTLSEFNDSAVARRRNMKLIQYKRQQTIEKVSEGIASESN